MLPPACTDDLARASAFCKTVGMGPSLRRTVCFGLSLLLNLPAATLVFHSGCVPAQPQVDPEPEPRVPDAGLQAPAAVAGRLLVQTDATGGAEVARAKPDGANRSVDTAAGEDESVRGELVIEFNPAVTAEEQDALLAAAGLELIERSPSGCVRALQRVSLEITDKRQRRLRTLQSRAALIGAPGVRSAELNARRYIARTPDDRFYTRQWHLATVNLPAAWELTTGSDDVVVAVIDTGVFSAHPDLQGRRQAIATPRRRSVPRPASTIPPVPRRRWRRSRIRASSPGCRPRPGPASSA